jgi:hypothetical protein
MNLDLTQVLLKNASLYHPVLNFDKEKDSLCLLDFTDQNVELRNIDYINTDTFSTYINKKLQENNCKFGIGGYKEKRILYNRSKLFAGEEPRNIHLGIDIWGDVGTTVMAPLGGMVHSFGFNNNFGDYGATIILQHQIETINFYTLYGHLSIADITYLRKGSVITRGEKFAHFGTPGENGNWPPHLHFQVIEDMGLYEGDYPGVCSVKEISKFVRNSPDPDLILGMMQYV